MPADRRISIDPTRADSMARVLRRHVLPGELARLVAMLTGEASEEVPTCTAKSKQTGERCGRTIAPEHLVCRWHGGETGHARNAAARRRSFVEALAGEPRPYAEAMRDHFRTLDEVAVQERDRYIARSSPTAWARMVETAQDALRFGKVMRDADALEDQARLDAQRLELMERIFVGAATRLGHDPGDHGVRAAFYAELQAAQPPRAIEGRAA